MNCENPKKQFIKNYEFKLFDDVDLMVEEIRILDNHYSLCKTVAGFSWPWVTKPKDRKLPKDDMSYYNHLVSKGLYDIKC